MARLRDRVQISRPAHRLARCSRQPRLTLQLPIRSSGFLRSILLNLRALHHDVAVRLHIDAAASLNRNVLPLDRDRPVFLHRYTGITRGDRYRITRRDGQIVGHRQRIILADGGRASPCHCSRLIRSYAHRSVRANIDGLIAADGHGPVGCDRIGLVRPHVRRLHRPDRDRLRRAYVDFLRSPDADRLIDADVVGTLERHGGGLAGADADRAIGADRDRLVGPDIFRPVRADRDRFVDPDLLRPVVADSDGLVVTYRLGTIMTDGLRLVVLHDDVLILLRVQVDLLRALHVLEAEFVEVGIATALAAAALDAALRGVRGQ